MPITQKPRSRAEQPWEPSHQYECSNGHRIGADRECCTCPACIHGVPCDGTLTRFGTGSRGARS